MTVTERAFLHASLRQKPSMQSSWFLKSAGLRNASATTRISAQASKIGQFMTEAFCLPQTLGNDGLVLAFQQGFPVVSFALEARRYGSKHAAIDDIQNHHSAKISLSLVARHRENRGRLRDKQNRTAKPGKK